MMTCHDDLIQLHVEGDLHPAEAAIVAEHLKDCAACRRKAGLYKGIFWDLARTPESVPALDEAEADALAARLQAEWQKGQPAHDRSNAAMATLWLTANPLVAGPARAVADASLAVTDAGLARLRRLLPWKGGGGR